jgi:hypothetical protein
LTHRAYGIRVAAAVAAALAGAFAIRYGLIEPEALGHACQAPRAPWWCLPRSAVVQAFHARALGLSSLVLGIAAHVPWSRFGGGARLGRLWAFLDRPRALAALALVFGALGLVLYNAALGAVGFVLGLVRAVRPFSSVRTDPY